MTDRGYQQASGHGLTRFTLCVLRKFEGLACLGYFFPPHVSFTTPPPRFLTRLILTFLLPPLVVKVSPPPLFLYFFWRSILLRR
jgi:hypothetical protein